MNRKFELADVVECINYGVYTAGLNESPWDHRIQCHAASKAEALTLAQFVLDAVNEKMKRDNREIVPAVVPEETKMFYRDQIR